MGKEDVVHNGVLVNHTHTKKNRNNATGSSMGGLRDYHTK